MEMVELVVELEVLELVEVQGRMAVVVMVEKVAGRAAVVAGKDPSSCEPGR